MTHIPEQIPRSKNVFGRILGAMIFWFMRFGIEGDLPPVKKMVVIAAPHTSNWDFIIFLGTIFKLNLKVRFLGKSTLFRWPFGFLMRNIGGMPVYRNKNAGIVDQAVAYFNQSEKMILALSPEGTRKRVDRWKTGFHRIALEAGVPIQLVAIDFKHRKVIFGPLFQPSDDLETDLETLQEYFRPFIGAKPHHQ